MFPSLSLMSNVGYRDEIVRRGGKPKDHARENKARIKQIETAIKDKEEEDAIQAALDSTMTHLKRFALTAQPRIDTGRRSTGDNTARSSRPSTRGSEADSTQEKHVTKNFLKQNAIKARSTPRKVSHKLCHATH